MRYVPTTVVVLDPETKKYVARYVVRDSFENRDDYSYSMHDKRDDVVTLCVALNR